MPESAYGLDFLCVVEADPAVTLAGIGFQEAPLRFTLASCLCNNGEHTLAGETAGAVVRAGTFADVQVGDGHSDRVKRAKSPML